MNMFEKKKKFDLLPCSDKDQRLPTPSELFFVQGKIEKLFNYFLLIVQETKTFRLPIESHELFTSYRIGYNFLYTLIVLLYQPIILYSLL
jgi:hypothetical protein